MTESKLIPRAEAERIRDRLHAAVNLFQSRGDLETALLQYRIEGVRLFAEREELYGMLAKFEEPITPATLMEHFAEIRAALASYRGETK